MTEPCDCHGRSATATALRGAVDNSAWDGPAAMSACTNSDTPASCFAAICAGKKSGDTSTQAAWALPHHKHPGDPPNAAGVRNGLARIGQTEGLTNKQAAQSHLEAHLSSINAEDSAAASEQRMRALAGDRAQVPNGKARAQMFHGAIYRAKPVTIGGTEYYEVEGYASVVDTPYVMYDMWGAYDEVIRAGAFDASLARTDLDVAFLTNHRGVTMARTTNDTLTLWADSTGLGAKARLRASREDVRTIVSAIDDGLVDEMSFAFYLEAGGWNEAYDKFTIYEADIHRGDVSAVNYGANPYTSIAARAGEILAELEHLPLGAARAAMVRLQGRADMVPLPGVSTDLAVVLGRAGGGTHGEFTGTHTHAHAANGQQGGDWQHTHAHDHAGDGDHGHAHGNAAPEPDHETSAPPLATQGGMSVELAAELARLDDEHDEDAGLTV